MDQNSNEKNSVLTLVIAWAWAGIPLAWGVLQTLHKASALFQK